MANQVKSWKLKQGLFRPALYIGLLLLLFLVSSVLLIPQNSVFEKGCGRRFFSTRIDEATQGVIGVPSGSRKTRASNRLAKGADRSPANMTTREITACLKRSEAKRLRSIKTVELENEYLVYAVFDIPSNEEKLEIRRLVSRIPPSDLPSDPTGPDEEQESLMRGYGIVEKMSGVAYYITVIKINKGDSEAGSYTSTAVRSGNLSYNDQNIPSATADFLNIIKHNKPFNLSNDCRFSEIIDY